MCSLIFGDGLLREHLSEMKDKVCKRELVTLRKRTIIRVDNIAHRRKEAIILEFYRVIRTSNFFSHFLALSCPLSFSLRVHPQVVMLILNGKVSHMMCI